MGVHTKRKHMIDFLFPLVLFCVFTLSALTIILLAAQTYRSTVENSALNDTARTALSYISEKIHQSDAADTISIGSFDGCDALVLKQAYDDSNYYTCIYFYEGELKEIFYKEGTEADASAGKTILAAENFTMSAISSELLQFSCTDANGHSASAAIGIKTMQ